VTLLIVGIVMVSQAEGDRLHGWRQTSCRIGRNFAQHNATEFTSVCVYFSVSEVVAGAGKAGGNGTQQDDDEWCAVPASIAGRGGLTDPPACSNLPTRDALDVDYWRIVQSNHTVECLVPARRDGDSGKIPADRCVATATSSGPGPALWRTWLDRFVYLVRDPREATEALASATRIQRGAGIGLIIAGGLLFPVAVALLAHRLLLRLCNGCHANNRRIGHVMRERYAQAHKLH
jgi:hypothetical protein